MDHPTGKNFINIFFHAHSPAHVRKKFPCVLLSAFLLLSLCLSGCGEAADEEETDTGDDYMLTVSGSQSSLEDMEVFPDFTATDLEGNTVTQEIFSEADITVVNIWATFCSPCIEEMPELAQWCEEMPENVQIIGIAADIESTSDGSTIADAEEILEEADAAFSNLIPCDDLSSLLHSIPGYPTTCFVDNDGDIVDVPVYGANISTYQYIVEQYLNGAYDENGNPIK